MKMLYCFFASGSVLGFPTILSMSGNKDREFKECLLVKKLGIFVVLFISFIYYYFYLVEGEVVEPNHIPSGKKIVTDVSQKVLCGVCSSYTIEVQIRKFTLWPFLPSRSTLKSW